MEKGLRWDEENLAANAAEAAAAQRQTIDEPKTPYHRGDSDATATDADDVDELVLPAAAKSRVPLPPTTSPTPTLAPTTPAPPTPVSGTEASADGAPSADASERASSEAKQRDFKRARRAHYNREAHGGLAALRAAAQAELDTADGPDVPENG